MINQAVTTYPAIVKELFRDFEERQTTDKVDPKAIDELTVKIQKQVPGNIRDKYSDSDYRRIRPIDIKSFLNF